MSIYSESYYQSILAQASYGRFEDCIIGGVSDVIASDNIKDNNGGGLQTNLPDLIVEQLLTRYDVQEFYPDDDTGFSATIFKDSDGRYVMAIRGTDMETDPWSDFYVSDLGGIITNGQAAGQITSAYRYYEDLVSRGFDIKGFSGLSLGGHIATAMSALTGIEAYSFAGPGFDAGWFQLPITAPHLALLLGVPIADVPFALLARELTGVPKTIGEAVVHDYMPDAFDILSVWNDRPWATGEESLFFIEHEFLADQELTHSNHNFIDGLAVYDLLASLGSASSQLTIPDLNELMKAMANADQRYEALERTVYEIAKALDVPGLLPLPIADDPKTDVASRNELHELIAAIKEHVGIEPNEFADLGLISLVSRPTSELAALATENTDLGRGVRYALQNLLPFAFSVMPTGSAMESAEYDVDQYSEQFWQDRADFLTLIIQRNGEDIPSTDTIPIASGESILYDDVATSTFVLTGDDDVPRIFKFGLETADPALAGSSKDDRLYGRGGNDTLHGNAGHDHLEGNTGNDTLYGDGDTDYLYGGAGDDHLYGGAGTDFLNGGDGSDTYHYNSGDGNDFIDDIDAGDRLVINGHAITSVEQMNDQDENVYEDTYGNTYVLTASGELLITVPNGDDADTITVSNFNRDTNHFGINFQDSAEAPEPLPGLLNIGSGDISGDPLRKEWAAREAYPVQQHVNLQGIYVEYPLLSRLWNYAELKNSSGNALDRTTWSWGGISYRDLNLEGTDFGDEFHGGNYGEYIFARGGDDLIYGYGEADFIFGGYGADTIFAGSGNDMVFGYAGDKYEPDATLNDSFGNELDDARDVLYGQDGRDAMSGDGGDDYINGGDGFDHLAGGVGKDTILGGAGEDIIFGDARMEATTNLGEVEILGNSQPIEGYDYDDLLLGGADKDIIYGELGDDLIDGGEGNDSLMGDYETFQNTAYGGGTRSDLDDINGNSHQLSGQHHGDDIILGGQGDDVIFGNGGDDLIDGGTENDRIWGDNSYLEGEYQGNDYLSGGSGDDFIVGGGGDDVIEGGQGANTIWGDEDVYDNQTPILLAGQYHSSDVIFTGDDAGNKVYGGGNDDEIHGGASSDLIFGDSKYGLTVVHYELGTYSGVIEGTNTLAETWHGNDVIHGGGGDDFIYAGAGNDLVYGDSGSDVLSGNAGDDTLNGGEGSDVLLGGAGNDTLIGGNGRDALMGGSGDDTYVIADNGSMDYIDDAEGQNKVRVSSSASLSEAELLFSNDYSFLAIPKDTGTISIQFGKENFSLGNFSLLDQFSSTAVSFLEFNQFHDYRVASESGVPVTSFQAGRGDDLVYTSDFDTAVDLGAGDDEVNASNGNDTITGGSGNDSLFGGFGSDTYLFRVGDGLDIISDVSDMDPVTPDYNVIRLGSGYSASSTKIDQVGNDLVIRSEEQDQIRVTNYFLNSDYKIDSIEFVSGGEIRLAGIADDALFGTASGDVLLGLDGQDTLYGAEGDDVLDGGVGDDIYLYNLGDGYDEINDLDGGSIVKFGIGISPQDVSITEDLERITIVVSQYDVEVGAIYITRSEGLSSLSDLISQVEFLDSGIVLPAESLRSLVNHITVPLFYDFQNEFMVPLSEFDLAPGQLQEAVYSATLLDGSPLPEWLVFDANSRKFSAFGDRNGLMSLEVAFSVVVDDQSVTRMIEFKVPDSVVYRPDSGGTYYGVDGIDQIVGGNSGFNYLYGQQGSSLIIGGELGDYLTGHSSNDILIGNGGDDSLTGNDGDDRLNGGAGNDQLTGGLGDDVLNGGGSGSGYDGLTGGKGNDQYLLENGFGRVAIGITHSAPTEVDTLAGERETVVITAEVNPNTALLSLINGGDLLVRFPETNEELIINSYFGDFGASNGYMPGQSVSIAFNNSHGPVLWEFDYIFSELFSGGLKGSAVDDDLDGSILNDKIYGYNGADRLEGLEGDDVLTGGTGDDLLIGGQGSDSLYGDADDDDLVGNDGNDILFGGSGSDGLDGGLGSDILYGGAGGDVLYQSSAESSLAATDWWYGEDGNDQLVATYGQVMMIGGLGSDEYRVSGYDQLKAIISDQGNITDIDTLNVEGNFVQLFRYQDDLLVRWMHSEGTVRISDWYRQSDNFIELINVDGKVANPSNLLVNTTHLQGTSEADELIGVDSASYPNSDEILKYSSDYINGGAGDDVITVTEGSDYLEGGAGDDVFLHENKSRDDIIDGGGGSNRFKVANQSIDLSQTQLLNFASIDVESSYDSFYQAPGFSELFATEGNDFIKIFVTGGSSCLAVVHGGAGNDTFSVDRSSSGVHTINGGAGVDTLLYSVTSGAVPFDSDDMPEIVDGTGSSGVLQFADGSNIDLSNTNLTGINQVLGYFIVGSRASDNIVAKGWADGGDGDDTISISDLVSVNFNYPASYGGAGNDIMSGHISHNALYGGVGNDNIYGYGGNDRLSGDQGNDQIYGGDGNDKLFGDLEESSPVSVSIGSDILDGGAGDDSLYSSGGLDTLTGGAGNDTYYVMLGANATINNISAVNAVDRLYLHKENGAFISESDLQFSLDGNDLVIGSSSESGSIVIKDWNLSVNNQVDIYLKSVQFGVNNQIGIEEINARLAGTWNNNVPSALPFVINTYSNSTITVNHSTIISNVVNSDGGLIIIDKILFPTDVFSLDPNYSNRVSLINKSFSGLVPVTYIGNDGSDSFMGQFNINVSYRNSAPIAVADSFTLERGTSLTIPVAELLKNDSDVNVADVLQINDVFQSVGGSARYDAVSGSITFTPYVGSSSTYSYNYRVSDGTTSSWATVSLNYIDDNSSLVLSDDELTASNSDLIYLDGASLLANDLDLNGDELTIVGVEQAFGGEVTYHADSDIIAFVPQSGFVGEAYFLYTVSDGSASLGTRTARVTIDVYGAGGVNFAPVVDHIIDSVSVVEDSSFSLTIPANTFFDRNGDALTYSVGTLPDWLSFNGTTFNGTPTNADVGSTPITVTASDGRASVSTNFTLTVTNTNDAPVVNMVLDNQTIREGNLLSFSVPAGSFTDVDAGDSLSYSASLSDGSPLPAWLTFNAATQTFNGTPGVSNVGNLNLRVTATDLAGVSAATTFSVTVSLYDLTLIGTDGMDTLTGSVGRDFLDGREGNDTLSGSDENDVLIGGLGNDTLDGGSGSDRYLFGRGDGQDVLNQYDTAGVSIYTDTVVFGEGIALTDLTLAKVGNDLLIRVAGVSDQLTMKNWFASASYQVDRFEFASGASLTASELINSFVVESIGGAANDTLTGHAGRDRMLGHAGTDTLSGLDGNDLLDGGDGNDTLNGNNGDDELNGGAGTDTLVGGVGNDSYLVDNTADVITEVAGEGLDVVQSSVTYTLSVNVENLTLTGSAAINATGNASNNVLTGNGAANTLSGGTGADSMSGGLGGDTYIVDNTADTVFENASEGLDLVQSSVTYTLSANVENLTLTGTSSINATGNTLDNVLTGNSGVNTLNGGTGNDTLNGGTGADRLVGGVGNDTYVVDNTGDVVTENASEGVDLVQSSITYTLASNVEQLTLTGTSALNGTGNTLDNVLTGNTGVNILTGGAGNDTLNGGTGADTLRGGAGNDTYVVDNTGDVVTENASEGTDVVQSSVTYSLASNVENLTLTGSSAINATGNTLNNTLVGNSAANTLSGGTGADSMSGGLGGDTYIVDNTGDTVIENASEGTDLVQSSVTYTLSANVENLALTGTSSINATGNTLDNVLTGNSGVNTLTGGAGNDTLSGGSGADRLVGGVGNDTYVVDNTGDAVTENVSEGVDLVQSSITYTLASNVENLTLTGTSSINATGNTLDNVLTGNSGVNTLTGGAGNDTLNGGSGADRLVGGTGNDTYVVDNTGDVVTERASEGVDLVQSSITYTLASNVENLTLTGSSVINATGNTLANVLTGNSGVNALTGGAGNDTLNGGAGADTLNGGDGSDTYLFAAGSGTDTLNNYDTNASSNDIARFAGRTAQDLWFSQSGSNLLITVAGTNDQVLVNGWYTNTNYQLDRIEVDSSYLLRTQVDQLVSAMSSFGVPVGAGNVVTQSVRDQLQPVLAASWQAA